MIIKVLGSGCANCNTLENRVKEVLQKHDFEATVEKITDFSVMMQYGLMGSPGLVINEKLVSSGKLLSHQQIIDLIKNNNNV
jgi:small redox-active disulfide protein 2